MQFEFSTEQESLRREVRRFFEGRCPTSVVRGVMEGATPFSEPVWRGMREMGLLGIVLPEQYGGLGLGYLELCVVAEEVGRALAPVPFSSSVYLATEFLLAAGSDAQRARLFPKLASGEAIGTFASTERAGAVTAGSIHARVRDGKLWGTKIGVPEGSIAHFAVVTAHEQAGLSLWLAELGSVARTTVETIDPSRDHATLVFEGAAVERIGAPGGATALIERVFDRAAVLSAFEQLGGSDRALAAACEYAKERRAFGRAIGSFQAIKHMLADVYAAITLARSNAYYGAWALSCDAPELARAAATARVSATTAYQQAARDNIQVHGGMGFTWEFDCHLHYKRSNLLALTLGGLGAWEDRLLGVIEASEGGVHGLQ